MEVSGKYPSVLILFYLHIVPTTALYASASNSRQDKPCTELDLIGRALKMDCVAKIRQSWFTSFLTTATFEHE